MIQQLIDRVKYWKDRKALKNANDGRDYGWYIEFKGEILLENS